jgi:hypothetical protein
VGGGAGWSHGRTAAAAAGGGGRRAKQPKRAPADEELLFEAELREVGSRFAAFHQSAASCGSRRARDLHKQLLCVLTLLTSNSLLHNTAAQQS